MRSVSQSFIDNSQADLRNISFQVSMAFDKTFDANITFFTIGDSLIGGGDIIKGSGDVVQEWDKYQYIDYSDRLIEIEWSQEVELFSSLTLSIADVTFDNTDNFFTPGAGSSIDGNISPYRPIRIYAGFKGELIQVFVGLTQSMPSIDEKSKTVTFHCLDFIYQTFNRSLDDALLYQNKRSDEVLTSLFVLAGLSASQLDFDEGLVTIPFAYFEKDTKFVAAIIKILEAEQGRIYMDGDGVIHFKNRQNYSSTNVMRFNAYDNILDFKTRDQDDIINVVEIKGQVREAQPLQEAWRLEVPKIIEAGATAQVWAEFSDPVTSVTAPEELSISTTSFFHVNTASDGSGADDTTDVTLTASSILGKTYKMTFTNSGVSDLYIIDILLYATPVPVIDQIYVREQNDDSVDEFEERLLSITNNFFQDNSDAQSKAIVIIADYKDFGGIGRMKVKGSMALELDDPIEVNVYDRIENYKITKIANRISLRGGYEQVIDMKIFTPAVFFTIGTSLIGGTDQIHP